MMHDPAVIARRMATQHWGPVERQCKIAPGIWWFSTAAHGGLIVDTDVRKELQEMNSTVYKGGIDYVNDQHFAAFEEDCQAAIVEWVYPSIIPEIQRKLFQDETSTHVYTAQRIALLRDSLQHWNPDWLKKYPEPGVPNRRGTEGVADVT